MKVYLYLRHFPAKGDRINDGLKKAIHGLACGLIECGANVTILSEASKAGDSCFKSSAGYTIRCFEHPIQSRPSFKISPGLKQYVDNELDINSLVVLNGILHPSIYSMSRLLRKARISYIAAPHDVYHPSMFRKNAHLKWPYWYFLEQQVLSQAAAIQVLDIRQAQWLYQLGIKTPIIEVSNGFSPKDIHSEHTLKWKEDEVIKIFFFGRIDASHKGIDLLLEAFAQIANQVNTQLTIQGRDAGDKKKLQERVAELSLTNKVFFVEPEYDQSASQIIANYDIVCLPSRFEGFGLSALEAMLAGRVLLVSEEAGVTPHVLASDCGVAVKPDISAIKSGLVALIQRRSEWKEMGARGQRYVLENLSWEKIASNALKQYMHLTASSEFPLKKAS